MSLPGECARKLRMLLGRRKWRTELDEEMRLHRELRGDDRRFGNDLRLRERSQEQWGWRGLDEFAQDCRHGLRLLARTPLITALALASLALGIGANTALFSLADALIFRSLPVAHPEQLVQLAVPEPESPNGLWGYFSYPMFKQLQQLPGPFTGSYASARIAANAVGATGGYFGILGIRPEAGRLFGPADDYRGCPAVADISDSYWRSRFGASSAAIGSAIALGSRSFQVIGVMPPSFFGTETDSWLNFAVPLCAGAVLRNAKLLDDKNSAFVQIFGRLRPGETMTQAQAQMDAMRPELFPALPSDSSAADRTAFLIRLRSAAAGTSYVRDSEGLPLEILLCVAGLVWLVACANLAALMLARAAARRPETAVRMALGASRWRLARQFLTESLLLAVGGAALGVGLAVWAARAAVHFWSYPTTPLVLNLAPDVRVLGFTVGLTLLTALLVGIAPALRCSDLKLASAARQEGPARALGWRLIAGQLAIALVLLAAGGLFLRSLARLTGPHKGFDARRVLLVQHDRYAHPRDEAKLAAARREIFERLQKLPGVTSAAASSVEPTQSSSWSGELWRPGAPKRTVLVNAVSPGYFATLRTPMLTGRDFRPADQDDVVILNRILARQLFPAGEALGKVVSAVSAFYPKATMVRVIGIAADASYTSLTVVSPPTAYFPLPAESYAYADFELRSSLPMAELQREASAIVASSPMKVALGPYTSLMDSSIKPERLLAWLGALFGGLALLLAALGLYGVTAYHAGRRRREFGIRMALGAGPGDVARQMLRDVGLALAWAVASGLALAWLGATAAQAALGKILFGISPRDAGTMALAALVLAAAAALAGYLPARRAARVDPMTSLRED